MVLGLHSVLSRIDKNDHAVDELEYAIKMITSNNLYEGFQFSSDNSSDDDDESDSVGQLANNNAIAVHERASLPSDATEQKRLIDLSKVSSNQSKDMKRRHTIAVGLGGNR